MLGPGASRRHIARALNTAYADGLLSEETFAHRLDRVFADRLIDPRALIGDLNLRTAPSRWHERLRGAAAAALGTVRLAGSEPLELAVLLLALDWDGGKSDLVLGRSRGCDVVLSIEAVSRRHAQLFFRDGNWVIRDLGSTNGTRVNGVRVSRCRLRPGDRVALGDALLRID
jgi:FHA domain-containing protein